MPEIYRSPKNRTPRCAPVGDDRGSWEVNLGTKKMCWNQTLTSTNIRSKPVNLMNKRVGVGVEGRGDKQEKRCAKKHPLWKLMCQKEKKK